MIPSRWAAPLLGVGFLALSLALRQLMLAHDPFLGSSTIDLATYVQAVRSLDHGQHALYTQRFGPWPGPFIYPPFAALLFRALLPFGLHGLQRLMETLSLLSLLASAAAAWALTGRRWTPGAVGGLAALCGLALWLVPVERTLCFGQVSLLLLAAVLVDCALPDRWRGKGVLVGLAAGFKLVPGLFLLYFLATRRYRAALVAAGTLLATVVLGALALPTAARIYWTRTVGLPQQINVHVTMADATNQALRPLLLRTLGEGRLSSALWAAGSVLVLAGGLAAARRAEALGERLLAVCLVGWVGVLVSPISWTHHWVWVVPTLLLLAEAVRRGVGRTRWAALTLAALTVAVTACWPMRLDRFGHWWSPGRLLPNALVMLGPHMDRRELHWTGREWLVGNSWILFGLALFAATVAALLVPAWRERRAGRTPTAAVPHGPAAEPTEEPSPPCRSTQQPSPQPRSGPSDVPASPRTG